MSTKSQSSIVRYYFKEILEDGLEHRLADIKDYTRSNADNNREISDATFSVTIKKIIDSKDSPYENVRYGVYQKTKGINPIDAIKERETAESFNYNKDNTCITDAPYIAEFIRILDKAIGETKTIYKNGAEELPDKEFASLLSAGKVVFDGLSNIKANINILQ